jgi:putative transposase
LKTPDRDPRPSRSRSIIAASKTGRRKGTNLLPKIIGAVRFQDGIEVIEVPANHVA